MSTVHSTRISLRLRELNQLFNSMDPSPFIDRDLDHDTEEFIVSSARETHNKGSFELVVHLATLPDPVKAGDTERAVQHYFSMRTELKRREFKLLLQRGHSYLGIGLGFLTVCLLLGAAKLIPVSLAPVLQESLVIAGWVAMWRPLETYLYDGWPVRREWTDLKRLGRMRVRLVLPTTGAANTTLLPEADLAAK